MRRSVALAIAISFVLALSLWAMAAPLEEESFAPPGGSEAPTGPPAGPPPGLADRDGDGLSDALQAKLAKAAPGEFFDVVVTFSHPGNAASAQAAVGRFRVFRHR